MAVHYNKNEIPKNVEELYASGWADFMRLKISRYRLYDFCNSIEDIFQDMIVQMLNNNFIERYDPTGRPFEVYLSVFIFNFMSKRYKKEHSKSGRAIVLAKSLEDTSPKDDEGFDGSVEYLDKLADDAAEFEGFTLLVESMREDLKQFKANSSVVHEGIVYQRDPLTVFELILQGYNVAEIAEIFETSKQFVYLLMKKIRGCDTLKDYGCAK